MLSYSSDSCNFRHVPALKPRSFSEALIACQSRYNLEYCNNVTNAAGRRSGSHYWHIGLDGMINLSNTTTVTKNDRTWNVEVVVAGAMEALTVTNRELVADALLTRYFMSTGADLGASLDSLLIWKQTGEDTYEALTRVDSADQLGAGNFVLVSNVIPWKP